jgi:hypothetical protein
MRLAMALGYVEGFVDPGLFQKRLGVKGIARAMAFERLEPFGFPIQNKRHVDRAMWSGMKFKDARTFGHKPPRKPGPMTADEIAEANLEAGM